MDEYFEYLDSVFTDEPNWFLAALKLCEKFGLSFDEAVDIIIKRYGRERA